MKKVDWSYHRPGCKTCGKTQDYLEQAGTDVKAQVNATQERYGQPEARELLAEVTQLLVTKGQKYLEFDLKKESPTEEELMKLIIGPTGNLRAPTLRVGKKLLVGFNEEMYQLVK